jgi:aldose 1-epimerase
MAAEAARDAALQPLAPGELLHIGNDHTQVAIAPAAGGRIAQLACEGIEWLCGYDSDNSAAIGWGCYPMLPWAGRIRHGRFAFDGREHQLALNLGAHAIHGVGFTLPWDVQTCSAVTIELALTLPRDGRWPFGGRAHQCLSVAGSRLRLELDVRAIEQDMPSPVIGWHPWFHKPERLDFAPTHHYPRDAAGIATAAVAGAAPAPWDDCFINTRPALLLRQGRNLRLTSSCDHWVVFDERAHVTCVEPQSGPPDSFNLRAGQRLARGESVSAWFELEWL